MIGLVWFLLLGGALGKSYPFSVWETHLKNVDSLVPFPLAKNSKMCYFFDISQACSAVAASDLGLGSPVDLETWAPGNDECRMILEGQRAYLEGMASTLFGRAISEADTAGVLNFELLTQSWILRVGVYSLVTDYEAFIDRMNGITEWFSVRCVGSILSSDGQESPLPDFIGQADCDILGSLQTCSSSDCLMTQAIYCCNNAATSTCCGVYSPNFQSLCQNAGCQVKEFCCSQDATSPCCA